MATRALCLWLLLTTLGSTAIRAQDPAAAPDSIAATRPPRRGSEFWIPFGSFLVPGLGQYIHHEPWAGLGYTATTVAGVLTSEMGNAVLDPIPRSGRDQLAFESLHVAVTSSFLSAWDAFHRPMPALRAAGKYEFLEREDGLGDLLTAPFDLRFLGRWTTWIDMAFTGAVTAWVLSDTDEGASYLPFRGHDALFATSLSLNAAVGEEALFRGWLLPMMTQKVGGRFWLANALQASLFGSLHPQAEAFALVIGAGAFYNGWVTRRNGWSVREVIFQHFWYDAAVMTASMLLDEGGTVTMLPVRIPL